MLMMLIIRLAGLLLLDDGLGHVTRWALCVLGVVDTPALGTMSYSHGQGRHSTFVRVERRNLARVLVLHRADDDCPLCRWLRLAGG